MLRVALLGSALGACASLPPGAEARSTPIRGETLGHICSTATADRFIGKPAASVTGTMIKRATRAAVVRWAPPGTMLTMDFRSDRVTVYLGSDRKITKLTCG